MRDRFISRDKSTACAVRGTALLAAAFGCILLAGCDAHSSAKPAPQPAAQPQAAPIAQAITPEEHDPLKYVTTGPLVAEQQADLAAEVDGRIAEIDVQVGDRVKKGQLLARLDDRMATAAVESQRAKLASLEAEVHEWESEQKAGEADLRRADYMRKERIRSEEEWERVKYKLDETIAAVARYRANRDAAEADLKLANLALEKTRITAPFDGVVGRGSLRLAQEVKKGDVLFWITAERPLRVLFTVPEGMMAAYKPGAPLELATADYPQLRQTARILRVSPVVDPASGSIQVIGLVENASPLLKPGMTMQVQLRP
ncbi:MAG TPA: efflux RND transporter periplasmic adaptor subunit [Terracidiphilus sp.]